MFNVGDCVHKVVGYKYKGVVVGVVIKRDGAKRFVVENDDGMLFIFNEAQLGLN